MKSLVAIAVAVIGVVVLWRRRNAKRLNLKGKVVVITGASSGIGREIATLMAKRGAHLVLAARRRPEIEAVAAECGALGAPSATPIVCDVTNDHDRKELFAAAQRIGGGAPLGLVVLNAGMGGITDFDSSDASLQIARDLMEVNYFANVGLLQLFLGALRQHRASVLVISSISGVLGTPQRTQYCASKFAMQGFCNALRTELKEAGAGLTVACPSFVQTDFHKKVLTAQGEAPNRKGKFMTPATCAELVVGAVDRGDSELIMTAHARLGYLLRPWMPTVVDSLAARTARGSVKK
jgi:short-subunit dehydrogenase